MWAFVSVDAGASENVLPCKCGLGRTLAISSLIPLRQNSWSNKDTRKARPCYLSRYLFFFFSSIREHSNSGFQKKEMLFNHYIALKALNVNIHISVFFLRLWLHLQRLCKQTVYQFWAPISRLPICECLEWFFTQKKHMSVVSPRQLQALWADSNIKVNNLNKRDKNTTVLS